MIKDNIKSGLRDDSELVFTHDIARLGARRGRWEASLFYRYDYYLRLHPDTVELYYRGRTEQPVEEGRAYRISLDVIHAQMFGFSLSREFEVTPNLIVRGQVNFMHADDLTDGSLKGEISVASDDTYTGSAVVNYAYDRDYLFDRPEVDPAKGWGASGDLYVTWNVTKSVAFEFSAEDLVSRIEWKDAPFTTATVNSSTTTFDENGLLDVQPVLSGLEGYADYVQTLPRRYQFRLGYRPEARWVSEFQLDSIEGFEFYRFNFEYQLASRLGLDFSVDLTRRALGLGGHYRNVRLFVLSDQLPFKDARALEIRLALSVPL